MKRICFSGIYFGFFVFFSCCTSPTPSHPFFSYDLHHVYKEKNPKKVMICFHGMGGDYRVTEQIEPYLEDVSLMSFNFPDHSLKLSNINFQKILIGTIDEILPALYVLKSAVIDQGFEEITLYGFSAGGAALINCLTVLNTSTYDSELRQIGIGFKEKKKMLKVFQNGEVILDTPLKSVDEVIARYGMTEEIKQIGARCKANMMDPIENLEKLKNLSFRILLHFQVPDEVLSNRDDDLFAERLRKYNQGSTTVLIGSDTGHSLPHPSLWKYYSEVFKVVQ